MIISYIPMSFALICTYAARCVVKFCQNKRWSALKTKIVFNERIYDRDRCICHESVFCNFIIISILFFLHISILLFTLLYTLWENFMLSV